MLLSASAPYFNPPGDIQSIPYNPLIANVTKWIGTVRYALRNGLLFCARQEPGGTREEEGSIV